MCGLIILIPELINNVLDLLNIDVSLIPFLSNIIGTDIYTKLLKYSKMLIILGIVFSVLTFIFRNIFDNLKNQTARGIKAYIQESERKSEEISQKKDLIMKEKQEKAKNTYVVYCPYCGADNILTSNIGTCKYCRRQIVAKENQTN